MHKLLINPNGGAFYKIIGLYSPKMSRPKKAKQTNKAKELFHNKETQPLNTWCDTGRRWWRGRDKI